MGFSRQEYWSGVPSPSPLGLSRMPVLLLLYDVAYSCQLQSVDWWYYWLQLCAYWFSPCCIYSDREVLKSTTPIVDSLIYPCSSISICLMYFDFLLVGVKPLMIVMFSCLACCSPWRCKESDTTERLNQTELMSSWGLSRWLSGKEPACNAGYTRDAGLIPGSGRSPGEGNGNPLQYSCLENSTDKRSLVGYRSWVGYDWTTEHMSSWMTDPLLCDTPLYLW